jgi:hypothetical protein
VKQGTKNDRERGKNEFARSLLMVGKKQEMCIVIVSFHYLAVGRGIGEQLSSASF